MNPSLFPTQKLSRLQRIALSLMGVLTIFTFVAANLHALLWQSSQWLVSTVLPAVVVELTNDERAVSNAAPLTRNATLDEAAKMKAEHMAKYEYFAHFSPDGVSPWHWFGEAGYVYAHAGENLAIHFTDSAEVVEAWMDSPLHRKNIVDAKFTEIGVGTAVGEFEGYKTVYVVQLFGTPAVAPKPAATVVVEAKPAPQVAETSLPAPDPVLETPATLAPAPQVAAAPETEDKVVEQLAVEPEKKSEPVLEIPETPESVPQAVAAEPVVLIADTDPVPASRPELKQEFDVRNTIPLSTPVSREVVMLEIDMMATSSGLAIASFVEPNQEPRHAGYTLFSAATQPNTVLQVVYTLLGMVVVVLLLASILLEARRLHYHQVAYGVFLLVMMSGLWYVHDLLTSGAVVA